MTDSHLNSPSSSESAGKLVAASGESVSGEQKKRSTSSGENREGSTARTGAPATEPRTRTKIIGGIEWYTIDTDDAGPVNDDGQYDDCQCARCGSSVAHTRCYNCGGEGYSHHDCGEDTCCCLNPDDNVICDICRGSGGWFCCISTPEYCETHPIPGRENIKSTAMNSEAYDD